MGDNSKIEWTDATWNPVTGCTKVSPGCDHCYAERVTERFKGPGSFATVALHPDRLGLPLSWRKPRKVFVNSMSDLFHDDVPDEYITKVFAVMAACPEHTFQVLTKRHGRMRSLLSRGTWGTAGFADDVEEAMAEFTHASLDRWPLPNVWLGVSVENQHWANIRIPALLDTPASIRFLSCEPLLGPVELTAKCNAWGRTWLDRIGAPGIDWVIVGGESGPGARLMQRDWVRSLRDECNAAGVAFHFKQWGEWAPTGTLSVGHLDDPKERHGESDPDGIYPDLDWKRLYRRVGKKAAGRELDGRTWDEYPAVAS